MGNRKKKIGLWKSKSARAVLLLAGILSMICVIRIMMPNQKYSYNGSTLFRQGESTENYSVFEGISLPAGVYRVELEYSCNTEMKSVCSIQDATVFFDGLLTQGEHFHSGLSKTDFHMWLFEKADAMQVVVNYNGEGVLETGNLHIYETNKLWGIYLTLIIATTLLVLAIQSAYLWNKKYGISRENKNVILGLTALIVIASVPYMKGSVSFGADLVYHLQRIEGIKDGILSGQFPVRIEPEWLYGHGYASGVFYCGTLLLFPALLRIIGFPVTFSYSCFCIALNAATALISYYSFSRIFKNKYIGLAGSVLYTLSIFRIYKLLIMAAVGEASALMFMPLILYGYWRVFTEDRGNNRYKTCWVPLAFGYAGLIQTHVLSCEITIFLTIILCFVLIRKIFCKEVFTELLKGAAGALVMSVWFLVPFLDYYLREDLHIKHVWARAIQNRGLYPAQLLFWRYGDNAVLGESGMLHSHALGVGFVLVLGFIVFGSLWIGGRLEREPIWKLGKLSMFFGGMLMLMSLEIFPWDTIQNLSHLTASLVSSLQFPNRFLGWGSAFLVVLFCCCLCYFREKNEILPYYVGIVCILLSVTTSSMYLYDHVDRDQKQLTLYNEEGMGFGYISGAEYLAEGTEQDKLIYHEPVASENVGIADYEKGSLSAELSCINNSKEQGYIELPLLYYSGYQAETADGNMQLEVCRGTNNLVKVMIPDGCVSKIHVRFVSPWYWRVAEGISYAGILCVVMILLRRWRRGWHESIPAKA